MNAPLSCISVSIVDLFYDLHAAIAHIIVETRNCTPEQVFQIERQIRSAHAYLAQRDVPPLEALDRIAHMACMAAIQLETIACIAATDCEQSDAIQRQCR